MNLAWKDEYELGIADLDSQHRQVLEVLNRLGADHSPLEVTAAINAINDYIEIHFRSEEAIMIANGYPDVTEHSNEHEKFRRLFVSIIRDNIDLHSGNFVLLSLLRWFVTHITSNQFDIHLGAYLRQRQSA